MTDFTPPDGINFHMREAVPLAALAQALCQVAVFLQDVGGYARLRRYEDWWQHDGLHLDRGALDLHGLFALVESPQAIYTAMPQDDHVRIGIAPENGEWYLRFYATWDEDGYNLQGDFDITLPERLAARFRRQVVETLPWPMDEEPAGAYYQRIRLSSSRHT